MWLAQRATDGAMLGNRRWSVRGAMAARQWSSMMESLGGLSEDEQELFEEHAAIAEYHGGMPRPIAEAGARRAVGHQRWQQSRRGRYR